MHTLIRRIIIPAIYLLAISFSGSVYSQGLFSSALARSGDTGTLDINGHVRGTIYTGWNYDDKADIKSGYGESALKLTSRPGKWGKAYADVRFRSGFDYGQAASLFELREAYVDLYMGKFDFRFGKQINLWGRADAFNPTQNLTPYDYFRRSPDEDDRRLGNLIMRGRFLPASFLRLELDWVPYYMPSVYRYELLDLPSFVSFEEGERPEFLLSNGSFGAKADLILNKFEFSLSYFTGFDAMPGLLPGSLPQPPFDNFIIVLHTASFRQSTLGGDFAVNIAKTGIRGELAWKTPKELNTGNPAVPMEEFSWALGADRSIGSFRLLVEYYGKKIRGFFLIEPPQEFNPLMLQDPSVWPYLESMFTEQFSYYNRVLFDQTDEWIHSLLVRPSVSLFHETLDLELAGMYNFTTEEYMLRPVITYRLADGIQCRAGYEYYYGPDNTRFDWISKVFSGPFAEVRISF